MSSLANHERLRGVSVARAILRDAFGLEMTLVDEKGPTAHQSGGVMRGSSELCRAALFSREGFVRCDRFYRELGAEGGWGTRPCHLGLTAVHVPVHRRGELVGHLVASGFIKPDRARDAAAELAVALAGLDPHHPDPSSVVRSLPVLDGSDRGVVRHILKAAAGEIEAQEEALARGLDDDGELPGLFGMVGASPRMRALFALLRRVVHSHASVLITGESGTGKELVARALHDHGPRGDGPFVAANCGAMADDVLESTLFGHIVGAYSGAVRASDGLFGAADAGTLFLDEVSEMSPAMQVKLLRVLQDGTFLPVGATKPRSTDVRIIAASHRDLAELVAGGSFRQDLFYRLHVLPIVLPSLRDRPGDLSLLLEHLMREVEGAPREITPAAVRCIERYPWPGNVRELRAEVERWAVSAGGELSVGPEHLSAVVREAGGYVGRKGGEAAAAAAAGRGSMSDAVEALERAIIERGLERTEGNRTRLAKELGISRTTLNERLKRYELG